MMKSALFGVLLGTGFIGALIAVPALGQEKKAQQIVAQVCSNCHGIDGNAISPQFPKLAGQSKDYLVSQLKAFKAQSRKDPDAHAYMWGLTRFLDDESIVLVAEYFAAQTPTRGPEGSAQAVSKGKDIYDKGIESKKVPACATCHGSNAQGASIFPRLAGQHAPYMIKQIRIYHTNDRPDSGTMMQTVVQDLSEEEAALVAAYLQGLP